MSGFQASTCMFREVVQVVMMIGHNMASATKKGSSKFEDSDSRMSTPRAVSELPQRPSPRLKAAPAGSEASIGGVTMRRHHVGVRGTTAPRSPLHDEKKKPADAGAGAGSRVAKLGKAHCELTATREQLTAAEKARKEARAALVQVKRRFIAAKKRDDDDVAASAVEGDAHDSKVMVAAAEVAKVLDAFVPTERENDAETEKTIYDGEKVSQEEVDELRAKLMAKDVEVYELREKLMAKDVEVYELRAKLMVRDTEVDKLRETLMANNAELDELRGKLASNDTEVNKLSACLMAKDADMAALEANNADLTKMTEAAAARARETEHALREARVAELLRASERAREATEAEARRSRAQSEQWRKAAEEAAVVLCGCGGVDRAIAGASGATGTPRPADKGCHGSAGSGVWRKPGGAMRVLSDLWKKAQK